jgi:hypothetical protein
MKTLLILSLIFSFSLSSEENIIAKVGEKNITETDIKTFLKLFPGPSPSLGVELSKPNYSLKQIINFHLALKEIEDSGFKEKETTKIFIQNALISYFLNEKIDKFIKKDKITYKKVKTYYKKNPAMNIDRIALAYQDKISLENAVSTLNFLKRDLEKGKITFKKAIAKATKYNGTEGLNGSYKKVFKDDLTLEQKAAIKGLGKNEYSKVIVGNGMVEIIKITKTLPFSKSYSSKIKQLIYLNKIYQARKKYFENLRKKHKSIIKINK